MSKIEDGGPAFPTDKVMSINDNVMAYATGMSLRDWFAGQVIAHYADQYMSEDRHKYAAQDAYAFADAMLVARKTGGDDV